MGWSIGYDSNWGRDIGYGVVAYCDHPDCDKTIDRGLAHVCANQEPYGGDGCGLYFCSKHNGHCCCERCRDGKDPFEPKPEHPRWIYWKLHHESWEQWRQDSPDEVKEFKSAWAAYENAIDLLEHARWYLYREKDEKANGILSNAELNLKLELHDAKRAYKDEVKSEKEDVEK